jgi:hypothetical protein
MSSQRSTRNNQERPIITAHLDTIKRMLIRIDSIPKKDITLHVNSVTDLLEYLLKHKTVLKWCPLLADNILHRISKLKVFYHEWKEVVNVRNGYACQQVAWNKVFLVSSCLTSILKKYATSE